MDTYLFDTDSLIVMTRPGLLIGAGAALAITAGITLATTAATIGVSESAKSDAQAASAGASWIGYQNAIALQQNDEAAALFQAMAGSSMSNLIA